MAGNAASTINQNQVPAEPSMRDLLNQHTQEVLLATNCHAIGTIQSFDPGTQTAEVTINYKKTYFEYNKETKQYNSVLVDYPILLNVPVISLYGGNLRMTFPIKRGDTCKLYFNDRDIDNWFSGSNTSAVATPRIHSLSDAIAFVGLRSLNDALGDYDQYRLVLGDDHCTIKIGDAAGGSASTIEIKKADASLTVLLGASSIKLSNGTTFIEVDATKLALTNATGSLGAALTQLLTALKACGTTLQSNPGVETAANAAGAALFTAATAVQTLITGLLV